MKQRKTLNSFITDRSLLVRSFVLNPHCQLVAVTVIEPSSYKGEGVSVHENLQFLKEALELSATSNISHCEALLPFRQHQASHIENVIQNSLVQLCPLQNTYVSSLLSSPQCDDYQRRQSGSSHFGYPRIQHLEKSLREYFDIVGGTRFHRDAELVDITSPRAIS